MVSSLFSAVLMAILLQQLLAEAHRKTECAKRCGNVVIEEPFGIGPNCYWNEYFAVTCNASSSSSTPKPVLTKFNVELVQLQKNEGEPYGGQITVNIPIAKAYADKKSAKGVKNEVLNLSGSPFFINSSANLFASIGCDGFASLYKETGGVIGRCTSTCNPGNEGVGIDGCNGYRCCQSEILGSFTRVGTIKISVSRVGSSRSAFIISKDFLRSNSNVAAAITHSLVVPAVLHWYMFMATPERRLSVRAAILGSITVVGVCVLVSSIWGCWFYKTKKKRKEAKLRVKYFKAILEQSSSDREVAYKTQLFTTKELNRATDDFNSDRVIGQGGQGTIYKGMLTDGRVIAVKRSNTFEEGQWQQFINEHIHNPNNELLLTWDMRLGIASEVASAIAYLHSSSSTPIYHRDIKSTNILLDDKFQAKVSDFGISKAISMDQTHLTTRVQGTFGYLDPEYFRSSQFSEKSDVYSFGVILVELLTGQRPIRVTTLEEEEERSLVVYFISAMNGSSLDRILDPHILLESTKEEVMLMANLAKRCLNSRGINRPSMKEVAMELEGLRRRPSSTSATLQQMSLEIEGAITIPAIVTDNAYTTSAVRDLVNNCHDNYDDEQPLFNTT